jgi:hypothetical protein
VLDTSTEDFISGRINTLYLKESKKMFTGNIQRATNYFKSMGRPDVRAEDIPWIAWGGQRPEWEYCCSSRYAGTMGGWLLKKRGTTQLKDCFYASEQPNADAFNRMENFKEWELYGSSCKFKCSICSRSFRSQDPEQDICIGCLSAATEKAKQEEQHEKERAENVQLQLDEVTDKASNLEEKLTDATNNSNLITAELNVAKEALANSNNKVASLSLELGSALAKGKDVEDNRKVLNDLAKNFSELSYTLATTSSNVFSVEQKTLILQAEKDELKREVEEINGCIEDMKRSLEVMPKAANPQSTSSTVLKQILDDIHYMFKNAFGSQRPNLRVSLDVIEQKVREWPPCFLSCVLQSGLIFNEIVSLGDFCDHLNKLYPTFGDRLKKYYNFGVYLNSDQEQISITHLPYRDIVSVNGTFEQSKQLPSQALREWRADSMMTCKSMFAKYMYTHNFPAMIKYKYITGVQLSIKEKSRSFEIWITLYMRCFRKANSRWEEDFPVASS